MQPGLLETLASREAIPASYTNETVSVIVVVRHSMCLDVLENVIMLLWGLVSWTHDVVDTSHGNAKR